MLAVLWGSEISQVYKEKEILSSFFYVESKTIQLVEVDIWSGIERCWEWGRMVKGYKVLREAVFFGGGLAVVSVWDRILHSLVNTVNISIVNISKIRVNFRYSYQKMMCLRWWIHSVENYRRFFCVFVFKEEISEFCGKGWESRENDYRRSWRMGCAYL